MNQKLQIDFDTLLKRPDSGWTLCFLQTVVDVVVVALSDAS